MVGGFEGRGFLAALMLPSGVEEGVMLVVLGLEIDPRAAGRSAGEWVGEEALLEGLEGSDGDEGEGLPNGTSESESALGVVTGEAMVDVGSGGGSLSVLAGRSAEESSRCKSARRRRRRQWPEG